MKSTDEVYGPLAYNGAPLLHVPVCVSRALLVVFLIHPVALWDWEVNCPSLNFIM